MVSQFTNCTHRIQILPFLLFAGFARVEHEHHRHKRISGNGKYGLITLSIEPTSNTYDISRLFLLFTEFLQMSIWLVSSAKEKWVVL